MKTIKPGKWNRSLGLSKREQEIETSKRPPVLVHWRLRGRRALAKIKKVIQQGHQFPPVSIPQDEVDTLSRAEKRVIHRNVKKGKAVIVIDDAPAINPLTA